MSDTDRTAFALPSTFGDRRIPVTVIGGFLGAGKTTLLNRLLDDSAGQRMAVLVNDFGSINIDAALVSDHQGELISLSNGCVCCQIGDDLSRSLSQVIESTPRADHIVIEASGVSDPWKIAQVALADAALALNGVLVLVDASTVRQTAADPTLSDTVMRQLNAADLLVVNKTDLIDADQLEQVTNWLADVAGSSPRWFTEQAHVPSTLLGLPNTTQPRIPQPSPRTVGRLLNWPARIGHGIRFESVSLEIDGQFCATALRQLLKQMPTGVLRLKGLLRTDQHPAAVLQFAGRHGSLRAWLPSDEAARRPRFDGRAKLVAIGVAGQLPSQELQRALRATLMTEVL